jgi:hypothetical protein
MDPVKQSLAARLREQAAACRDMGSPLYTSLLERAADDVQAGGPTWEILRGHENDSWGSMLPLRLTGSVHRLALEGRAPDLAQVYSSSGASADDAWLAFRTVVADHLGPLRELIEHPVQTNEVGRAAVLLGGFVLVADETRLPLRCLEVGASAGLNLRWDHYRYESGEVAWGPVDSPVRFTDVFTDGLPPRASSFAIAERRGCDLQPVDLTTNEGRLTLLSYVWPDQTERLERLRAAFEVATAVPVEVDRADALEWTEQRLSELAPGRATVLFHSITALYFDSEYRRRFEDTIERAGERATTEAPLAWLSLELVGERRFETRLRLWPRGEDRLIALSGPHGPPVEWLGGT